MICLDLMDMRGLRERAAISPEEAAFKLKVAHSTIRNWESGKTEPSLGVTKISDLMKLYDCSFEELLQAVIETKNKSN
ncbi:helix-turn-helix transcriptional regulator [Acaryochloris sp. 'Moss Beach']|uniref:helix-turn-helix domain-containing protein n=1 Tax=Acaryochloris sp. 'Moss Beach' TaxID=2740837 RepID=UPI001F22EDAD|nr:helix-turn-helix transcriptional regulator [Acaryochloris sp. 'Moss Beach']